jgi:hypothetical protein
MRHLFTLLLLSALVGLTGCQSVDDRIKQKPDVFAAVDKATQDKIKQGIIDLGYTPDMVYLALGAPDQKRETVTAAGMSISWIYSTYYQRYDGTAFVGYERRVYYDPGIRSYRLYYHPAYIDTYHEEKDERIRVVFKDGKAAVIEQTKE